jgi:hypothetical protein
LHQYEKSVEIDPVLHLPEKRRKGLLKEPVKGRQGEGPAMPPRGRSSIDRFGCRIDARATARGASFFMGTCEIEREDSQ